MTTCTRCHRPLRLPTETGMGPTCARLMRAVPVPPHERDLFGYDIDRGVHAAMYQVRVLVESMAAEAHAAVRKSFREARVRAGVWAA